jgi:proteasome accessory factor C
MSGARDQVARLLALAPYLQAREGGVPLARVAADFGVKPAQIVKDLRVLFMCGLPGLGPGDMVDVDFEAFEDDPDGVVRIENADFLARPVRLGSSEASALIVALRALREGSDDDSREVIDRALTKLEDATTGGPPPAAVEVHPAPARERDRLTADRLRQAIADDRQVRLRYYVPTRDETTDRVVDPLAVLTEDGKTYLDAWCHNAEGRRLFRLDRVHEADVLDAARVAHDVPPRDLSAGLFAAGPDDIEARVHLAPGLRWVADYYPVLATTEADDGGLVVTLAVGDPQWLVRTALRLAPGLTVLSPPAIVDQLAVTTGTLRSLYATA